jgi:hypothetical protein
MRLMDSSQEQELRHWAEALSASGDGERRATGRAIVMLLDRIAELERELAARDAGAEVGPSDEEEWEAGEEEQLDEPLSSLEDTRPLSLRDRLRSAAERLTDR